MEEKKEFEKWLRMTCFQKPTPEAYDLAKSAWLEAYKRAAEHNQKLILEKTEWK